MVYIIRNKGDIMIFFEKKCPDKIHSLVFEEDDKVAYAYLLKDGKIITDVWLFNVIESPREPEWNLDNRSKYMPFANPKSLIDASNFIRPDREEQIYVGWFIHDEKLQKAFIFIDNVLHATIAPNEKPGHCRLVIKDGPLARILS